MFGPICQSCGMPLSKDPEHGGSDENGMLSREYCSKCYVNGAFVRPNMTKEEMIELVKGKLKEMGFPAFLAGLFTRNIPKLKRWKSPSS